MPYFGIPIRNGVPIGLGSVAGFGIAPEFSPSELFTGGVQGAWFDPSDSTTLFSDRAGTTPCAAPGAGALVPVGAMLDERAPGYSVYFDGSGDYLSTPTNANFAFGTGNYTVEMWFYATSLTGYRALFLSGQSVSPAGSGNYSLYVNSGTSIEIYDAGVGPAKVNVAVSLSTNTWYHLAVTRNSGSTRVFINGALQGTTVTDTFSYVSSGGSVTVGIDISSTPLQLYPFIGYISNLRIVKGTAVYTGNFTPPTAPLAPISGTSLLTCGTSWSGNPAITKNGDARVDGLNPFVASPVGNHAIAANDTTARPELSARVNLLTYTEQFDNAAWTKTALNTTGTPAWVNAAVAPDGTTTADKLIPNTSSTGHFAAFPPFTGATNIAYRASIYAKDGGYRYVGLSDGATGQAVYDLQTGAIIATDPGITASPAVNVGNGWWRLQISFVASSSRGIGVDVWNSNPPAIFAGNGTDGVLVWGADLRPANIGTTIPAYQRVADQYTYDTVGFPRWLAANGTSSAMSTPNNIPFATVTSDGLARRNLLSVPTLFDDATWTKATTSSAANTTAVNDPFGGTAADLYSQISASPYIAQGVTLTTATSVTVSCYFRKNVGDFINVFCADTTTLSNGFRCVLNASTGQKGTEGTFGSGATFTSASVQNAGNGWYRLVVTGQVGAAVTAISFGFYVSDADGSGTRLIPGSVYIYGAQLETGSTATAFQNIGTDKVTVFAGVRKLSDATNGTVAELSPIESSNNGSFFIGAPAAAPAANYWFTLRGTTSTAFGATTFTSPNSAVLSVGMDIAGAARATELFPRVNGAIPTLTGADSADAGTGNFGSYPLFIGARNTSTFRLNGNIYSLIVAGSAVSAGNITATEQWVAGKTGITAP